MKMSDAGAECAACGVCMPNIDGIFRCVPDSRRVALTAFLAQYRHVREMDGYRQRDARYYRALPDAPQDDPHAQVWRIRQRSFEHIRRLVCKRLIPSEPRVLDVGAGNGWLSHRLTALGCRAVAVDLLADEQDGLGARRHYAQTFPCLEADFDQLPLAAAQFDAVIFNGSLHYSPDPVATLEHARRLLAPGGLVLVVDSPMFVRDDDGAAMRARVHERLHREYGLASPIHPGNGFLTFGTLGAWAEQRALSHRFIRSEAHWRDRVWRAGITRLFRSPQPAAFGVWVAA